MTHTAHSGPPPATGLVVWGLGHPAPTITSVTMLTPEGKGVEGVA